MSTYVVKIKGSTVCDTNRVERGSNNTNITNWNIGHLFIYCVAIGQDGRDPPAAVLKLQWRVVGGAYADLGATGAIKYTTGTVLTNDNAVADTERKIAVSNMTWQEGWEVEDGVAPTIDIGNDGYSELQFACDPADATVGSTYEFQLYNNTASAAVLIETGSMLTMKMSTSLGVSVADCVAPLTKLGGN